MKREFVAGMTLILMLSFGLAGGWFGAGPASAQTQAAGIERDLGQAKKLGAKGQLPNTWWSLDARFKSARDDGATAAAWEVLATDARRLVNAAVFVKEMRQQKSDLEATLGRFDQALLEIATLYGVDYDPTLTGTALATELLDALTRDKLQRQVVIDSLTVQNRHLTESVGGRAEAQEATITALRVELSSVRKQLWETELRVGVAEADRSAAETVLTVKQEREQAIDATRRLFGPDEAEILVTADDAVVMRLFGVSFGVGSSQLSGGQGDFVERIAEAARGFPSSLIRLEGHTDDTGGRDANLRLSRRRAETVARLLETHLGLDAESIETAGFGPDRPISLNSTPEGRAHNRRIDVIIQPAD